MLSVAILSAGCTADEQTGLQTDSIPVQLTVSQDATGGFTRTTRDLHSAATGFAVNETMTVFLKNGSTTTNKVYKVSSASAGTATLAPNADNEKLYYPTGTSGSVQLYAVYPSGITSGGTHTVAYDQTGDANYNSSDLMYSAAKTVNLSDKGNQQALNSFQHKMVRLKLNIIKSSDVSSVTEVKMVNVKRQVTVSTLNEDGITVGTGTSTGDSNGDNILIFSGTNNVTTQQTYYVVFPKQQSSGTNDWDGTNFLSVTADGSTVNYTLTKAFTAGNQYELTLNINVAALNNTISITGWTDTQSATVQPTKEAALPDRTPAGVNAVDLGLYVGGADSGKKLFWADRNIGATSVTDYGLYFAWGDVLGRSGTVSSGTTAADGYSFSWTNTPYNYGSSSFAATKYNSTDDLPKLEACDDAAAMNWGGKWRMPTKAEMEKLAALTNAWTTDYNGSGVAGRTFTGNGNTIFLPAAGFRNGTSVSDRGSFGDYWSSLLRTDRPSYALYLGFSVSSVDVLNNFSRYYGFTVRPVREE